MAFADYFNTDLDSFTSPEAAQQRIRQACEEGGSRMKYLNAGESEEGRPIYGAVLGSGKRHVSLIAGSHSDEPVGPETLRQLIIQLPGLLPKPGMEELLEDFTFVVIPHINPDGEAMNRPWIDAWPDLEAYLQQVHREQPGRDLEFGYPDMRVENRAVSRIMKRFAPLSLHMSLHGMAFSEGMMLLIERHWIDRTKAFRESFRLAVRKAGLELHDHNRGGEKGFDYIGPGFTTTPEGRAMQQYFEDQGDPETAGLFHLSSMEYAREISGNPLCVVTELPLFRVQFEDHRPSPPGNPKAYLALKQKLPVIRKKMDKNDMEGAGRELEPFDIQSLPLSTSIHLQLRVLELSLRALGR